MAENTSKTKTEKIVSYLLILVIGILFCLRIAADVVSIIIGIALIVTGAFNITLLAAKKLPIIMPSGIYGGLLVALGIIFIVYKIIGIVMGWIPYVVIVIGTLLFADAFLGKFTRNENVALFVVKLLLGAAAIALGLCLIFIEGFGSWAQVVFGILLIAYAVFCLVSLLVKKQANN